MACRRFSLLLSTGKPIGVFTDGDLCRIIDHKVNLQHAVVKDVMNADCRTICAGMLVAEVPQRMGSTRINALPAVNAENERVGALDMRDLLRADMV